MENSDESLNYSNKQKILFVSGRFPYPMHKGDQYTLFNNIKLISLKYKVTLITFYDHESELHNLQEVEKFCEKIVLVKRSQIFSYINILLSVFRLEPMQVSYYRSGLFNKKLKALLDVDRFDIINVYMLRMAQYVQDIPVCKVINLIDSMHLNMSRRALNEIGFKKVIFKYEAWLLKNYEKKCAGWFDKGMVVSSIDKEFMDNSNIKVIPIGVDLHERKDYKQSKTIIFTGNMAYFPNQDAVRWFVDNCLKLILDKISDVRFVIVGKSPPPLIMQLDDGKNIFVKGFVKSIQSEMQNSAIAVAPMQSGSGMQIKVLEAMAAGLPMVVTSLGLGDILAKNGDSVLVANTAEDFALMCVSLLKNTNQRIDVGKAASSYVKQNHSWEGIQKQYIDLYGDALFSHHNRKVL